MEEGIKWTYLPWMTQSTAGDICWVVVVVGAVFILVTQCIRRTKSGYDLHEAPFVTMECTVLALLVNTAMFALFFWYAALAASLFFSLMFYLSARGMQKKIYFEEKDGRWGLHPPLRQVRGELFSDLPIEEQLEYKKKIDATFKKVQPWWYFPLTIAVPFAVVLIMRLCGFDYIFTPQPIV